MAQPLKHPQSESVVMDLSLMLCASFDENLLTIFNVVVEKPLAFLYTLYF